MGEKYIFDDCGQEGWRNVADSDGFPPPTAGMTKRDGFPITNVGNDSLLGPSSPHCSSVIPAVGGGD
ncbi:MAG: hypothetical protein OEY80_10495, partial [Nitrospirota bacterium]|nr:hypothetical protein [Nitrospirota bacterium]